MAEDSILYTAVYADIDSALADLKSFEQLHKDKIVGKYDAAVIDQEDGKPHIVKRTDRPSIRVIPEWFGSGTLPRHDLHEAARALDAGEAALIVIGEATLAEGFEKAVTRASRTVKRDLDVEADALAKELKETVKQ